MEPITTITGTAIPLERSDVDTDQIIPAEWLKRVERTGFGEGLFAAWRKDATFPLNDRRYEDAVILIAGPNFGTGSSREHAVWALTDYGFKVVISSRFADIFRGNSGKAGLLAAQGLLDEFFVTIAPRVIAGSSARVAHGPEADASLWELAHGFLDDDGFLFLRYCRCV